MKKTFTEEELEEVSDDELGGQLPPEEENGAKKRGARYLDDDANADEEFPEVLTMIEGKSKAQQLRSEERANERRIAAEAKKKVRERAAARKSEKASGDEGLSPLDEPKAEKEDTQTAQRDDRLDDSVIQFLTARERAETEGNVEPSPPKELIKKKRLKSKTDLSNGRFQVVDLSQNSSFVEERNAVEFKYGHLYGGRIKRDASMLRNLARIS